MAAIAVSTATAPVAANNFLLPNGTLLAELLLFAIILVVMLRFIVPPVQRAMRERNRLIHGEFDEARRARERADAAHEEYEKCLDDARAEATRIRDAARAEGQQEIDRRRAEAQAEADRLLAESRQQLDRERAALERDLREEMARLAVDLAGRIVGEPVEEDVERRGTVRRFLAEQDGGTSETPAGAAAGEAR